MRAVLKPSDPVTTAVAPQAFRQSTIPAANVASVPQRSPLRYPGGKTWLVPHVRKWLSAPVDVLIEPFAGGGIVSLTAVMEGRAERALMVDLDRDVSSFWRATLEHSDDMIARILALRPDRAAVERIAQEVPSTVLDHGFRTLVLNRTRRGGVLAPGASLIRSGENGAGICSRWYPDTLARRIREIAAYSDRLLFCEGDGVRLLEMLCSQPGARFFIDPHTLPAAASRQARGSMLTTPWTTPRIFEALASSQADFMMTYDCSSEIVSLVRQHGFHGAVVEMKSGHHLKIPELVITRDRLFT